MTLKAIIDPPALESSAEMPGPTAGWLVIDKAYGVGSTDVVRHVRRLFRTRRVGHAGTLDPLASGILPIAVGQATKTIPYIVDSLKRYRFTISFGARRSTDDREGEVIAVSDVRPSDEQLIAALPHFQGDIMQVPPSYSAIKINGQRAYKLSRAGNAPCLPPRNVSVYSLELTERLDSDHAEFSVVCGKGTYVRSLARDIAQHCGSEGHVSALRREQCGPFGRKDAITLDKLLQNSDKAETLLAFLRPVSTALADIPALAVTSEEARALRHGKTIQPENAIDLLGSHDAQAIYRAECDGDLVGICRAKNGVVQPIRNF